MKPVPHNTLLAHSAAVVGGDARDLWSWRLLKVLIGFISYRIQALSSC